MSDLSTAPAAAAADAANNGVSARAEPVLIQAPATRDGQPADADAAAGEAPPAEDPKARKRRRLKLILAVVGAFVCVLGVGAGAGAAIVGARPHELELAVNTPSSYYALPEVIGTLAPQGQRTRRVRLGVTLEVEEANLAQVKAQEAAIVGATQEHLLDLRTSDLAGRAGAENLRTYIREVVQARTAAGVVRNVLFTTFIVD